jgi:phosphoribosylaminoimidazole-succinocarboxamide synthase
MTAALAELKLHSSGKVREMYEVDGDLLMVASDRISAYDVIMPSPIPDKGRVLTQMSLFWFDSTAAICPNHFLSDEVPEEVAARAIRVRRLDMYPVECVVRGYLSGSGWREYRESGAVCGIDLPAGLRRGIILADTKFEFGASSDAAVVLGDEVFTPDSSRFWPADEYEPGRPQRSFDKQYLRDWLDEIGWDRIPPAPELPPEVIANTRAKYLEAYERITGRSSND